MYFVLLNNAVWHLRAVSVSDEQARRFQRNRSGRGLIPEAQESVRLPVSQAR
jgi:hypothetical protein